MVWRCGKEMREAESVMPVETYLNRRMLQWYGDVGRRVERQRVSCSCGDMPSFRCAMLQRHAAPPFFRIDTIII